MAWPHFMSSSFPSSAVNTDHALKPSMFFPNAEASSDIPQKNGYRSASNHHLLRNLYEGEVSGPDSEASGGAKGSSGEGSGFREVTLEDYLEKARGAKQDLKATPTASDRIGVKFDLEEARNQMVGVVDGIPTAGGERGRGRKRPAEDSVDRAALQRQKRMIKNRESAARSRERKQQYTNQLEQTVFMLEEQNALLIKERDDLLKWRFKQVVENVVPVTAEKKSAKSLRRANSFP